MKSFKFKRVGGASHAPAASKKPSSHRHSAGPSRADWPVGREHLDGAFSAKTQVTLVFTGRHTAHGRRRAGVTGWVAGRACERASHGGTVCQARQCDPPAWIARCRRVTSVRSHTQQAALICMSIGANIACHDATITPSVGQVQPDCPAAYLPRVQPDSSDTRRCAVLHEMQFSGNAQSLTH